MSHQRTPFDSIEGSLEYVGLLREAVQEAKDSVGEEAARAGSEGAARRLEALRLVTYKLDRLGGHVAATHRLLQDLRTLRRLLRGERQSVDEAPAFSTENAPRSHKSDAAAN
jgi:hypothetical protein